MAEGMGTGGWFTDDPSMGEKSEIPEDQTEQVTERKTEISEEEVAALKTFDRELNPRKDLILYPSCATDVSPSAAFPENRVVYVDIDEPSIDALKKAGYEAVNQSALDYDPGTPIDVLILYNQAIRVKTLLAKVRDGGFVICNNYHQAASETKADDQFEFIGAVSENDEKGLHIDKENPDNYWTEVETDEELKRAISGWSNASYEEARDVVEAFNGDLENVVKEYKKIFKEAKEDADKLGVDLGDIVPVHTEDGRNFTLTPLPKKKGHADTNYIFRKKILEEE